MPRLLFGEDDLPAWLPPMFRPGRIQYGQEVRRTCGCWLDPVVFGHHHTAGAL